MAVLSPRNPKPILIKSLLWFGGGLLLLVLIVVASLHVQRVSAEAALAEKLTELEAAGLPTTLEEIHRRYHDHNRAPGDNASPLYDLAFARRLSEGLPVDELGEALRLTVDRQALSPERVKAIGEVVAANEESIRLLREAGTLPYLRRDLNFRDGADLLIPHVGHLRESARLLAGEAMVAAEEGDSERAATALATLFRLALHLSEEPTVISQLTRIAIEGIGLIALERVLDRIEIPPPSLDFLAAHIRATENAPRMRSAFEAELAAVGWHFSHFTDARSIMLDGEPRVWERLAYFFYRATGRLHRDQRLYLTQMERFLPTVDLPHSARLQLDWEEFASDAEASEVGAILASITIPTLGRVLESDSRTVTGLRAARIALAAERFRMEQGSFPASLEELVPHYLEEIPTDPFRADGRFEWVQEEDAFFVRSAGTIELRSASGAVPIGLRLPSR
jgi:hypothetical protein